MSEKRSLSDIKTCPVCDGPLSVETQRFGKGIGDQVQLMCEHCRATVKITMPGDDGSRTH